MEEMCLSFWGQGPQWTDQQYERQGSDDTEGQWGVNVIILIVIYLTRPYRYKRCLY